MGVVSSVRRNGFCESEVLWVREVGEENEGDTHNVSPGAVTSVCYLVQFYEKIKMIEMILSFLWKRQQHLFNFPLTLLLYKGAL